MKSIIVILLFVLFLPNIAYSSGIREEINENRNLGVGTVSYNTVYEALREAFPSVSYFTTNRYNSNFLSISIEDISERIADKFSYNDLQSLILILKQENDPVKDMFLRYFELMTRKDFGKSINYFLSINIEYDDDISYSLLDCVVPELSHWIEYIIYEINYEITKFLWEHEDIISFTFENRDYKLIGTTVYRYYDMVGLSPASINFYDGHYFVFRNEHEPWDVYERSGGLESKRYFAFAQEYEIIDGELKPKYIPNIDVHTFETAPLSFYFRFMIENSMAFEELILSEIKEIDGMFFYRDSVREEVRPFRSNGGLYKIIKNGEEIIYLNGQRQAVYNGQLLPQLFIDMANEDGAVVFSYSNMWINVKPNHVDWDEPYINPVKTIYVVDKDGNFWFVRNGECIRADNMAVDPVYAQKIENFSDNYLMYLNGNHQRILTQDEKNTIEDGLTRCRWLMRQWRDERENEQVIFDEIDSILMELNIILGH